MICMFCHNEISVVGKGLDDLMLLVRVNIMFKGVREV